MTRRHIAAGLQSLYRGAVSPALHSLGALNPFPGGCRFQPTCSEYAAISLARFGFVRGGALAVWRLLRCHPFSRGGFDPVPLAGGQAKTCHLP